MRLFLSSKVILKDDIEFLNIIEMKKNTLLFLCLGLALWTNKIYAQDRVTGRVIDKDLQALEYVNIYWEGTSLGTTSKKGGYFEIEKSSDSDRLVLSFLGFQIKTLWVKQNEIGDVILENKSNALDDVMVGSRRESEIISKISTLKTEKLTTAALEKLPCCHLAASFENTLSVDKTYPDAVTGTEEIRMLGLAGVYTQILSEEVPVGRGLSSSLGLHIPGAYLKSVSISQGVGSVISGYEGITGQIQMFLKQAENSDRFFLNLYANSFNSKDINVLKSIKFSEKWNSMLFLHASSHDGKFDHNSDSFMDMPTGITGNLTQTFKYDKPGVYRHQLGYRLTYNESNGGQMDFDKNENPLISENYGVGITNHRMELFSNQMFKLNAFGDVTFGIKTNYVYSKQESYFGRRSYSGREDNFNSSLNIEKKWSKYKQKLNFGSSFIYDEFQEVFNVNPFRREELVPGIHAEYTLQPQNNITLIGGYRVDFHNIYGNLSAPRFHFKYNFTEHSVFRLLAGKAFRVANPIIDNLGLLVSSREWVLPQTNQDLLESAWSFGANLSHDFKIGKRTLAIALDYYHTSFNDKVIVDLYSDPQRVMFYPLNGKSFADNYQVSLSIDIIKNLQFKVAGRYNNIKETYAGKLQDKLYNAKFKGLATLSYATKYSKWKFDLTNQLIGKTKLTPLEGQKYQDYAPAFYQLHAQITRRFKHFDVYVAGENLTNYKQDHPIVSSSDPFSESFDASRVWAPILGAKFSVGVRFKIK